MAYRADIEIAVKGAQELKRLQDRIQNVSTTVDNFNSKIENIGGGYIVRNINNLTSLLGQAAVEFNKVALGTEDATTAARVYVAANDKLNAGLAERVALLKSVNEQARQARLAEGNKRFGGPRIVETSNAYGGQIGPGPVSPVALRSNLGNRVENALKAQSQAAIDASTNLRVKQSWNKFFRDAAALGTDLQVNAAAQKLNIKSSWNKFFRDAAAPVGSAPVKSGGGIGKGISGAVSNAAIGGAFPLLFGQSGAAAAGGALGGIAGSFLGPSGGFAGSLVGTILGEKIGQGNQVKQLGEDIGFSAEQTKLLGIAFQQAGRDFDTFQQSVSTIQGLSLSIEDQGRAIQLASSLTESYKGKIDKVTNAFANALSTGKVTQGTLNQLTGQGIPIQQALAEKYGVSRSAIIQMAKDGKISVQDLIDTLVKVGNEGAKAAGTQKDVFADSFEQISKAVADFQTTASKAFKETGDALRVDLGGAVQAVTTYITDLIGGFGELARVAGPVLDPIISGYINLEKAIFNAVGAVPALKDAIVSFVFTTLGPLQGVVTLMNQIRGLGAAAKGPEKMGPYVPDRLKQKPLQSFIAPSQAVPSSGSSGADKAAKAAEREAARVANIVRDRAAEMEIMRMQLIFAEQIAVAEINKDPILKSQLQTTEKINQISINYSKAINDEKAKGNSILAKEAITKEAVAEIDKVNFEGALDIARIEIERKENYDNLLMDLDQELKLRAATTEEARNQLRIDYEIAKLKQGNQFTDPQLAAIKGRKQAIAAPKTDRELVGDRLGKLRDELTELTRLSTIVITAADSIGNAFSTSFKGVIDGSMTAREALGSFFQSVADAFLDMAAQIIAKWITMTILNSVLQLFPGGGLAKSGGSGFDMGAINNTGLGTFNPANSFPGLATGGPAMANTPYIVGEKGPELFMPGRSGTVIPNDALGGGGSTSVVVNVDASGNSNVQGDQAQAKQLGVAVSAAVQAELVKQQRPGGLLAGTRR